MAVDKPKALNKGLQDASDVWTRPTRMLRVMQRHGEGAKTRSGSGDCLIAPGGR
jgi:hypothetical protein